MHKSKGYVVVAATPVQFPATVETIIVPKTLYKVTVPFGNKTIYLDPKDKKSAMSQTLDGVPQILKERKVIEDYEVQLLVTLIILDVWILFGQKKDIFVKNKNNG